MLILRWSSARASGGDAEMFAESTTNASVPRSGAGRNYQRL
jgi:hypothetical protein